MGGIEKDAIKEVLSKSGVCEEDKVRLLGNWATDVEGAIQGSKCECGLPAFVH
jgi:hypothetical protein